MIIFEKQPIELEEKSVLEWCIQNNYDYDIVPIKKINRKIFLVNKNTCPIGNIPYIHSCLKQLNISYDYNCYPDELHSFLDRKIQETIVKHIHRSYPFFIKPSRRLKKFTGRIIHYKNELYGIPKNEYVWISDLKEIKSEWRIYIINKQKRYISFCDGDRQYIPDMKIINDILKCLTDRPCYNGCSIDIAVNESQTFFLELNDGYSLGLYEGIPIDTYVELLMNRWKAYFLSSIA